MRRREFLGGALGLWLAAGCSRARSPDLGGLSVEQLSQAFQQGTLTPSELLEDCLRRIDSLNPTLRAVLAVSPLARPRAGEKRAFRLAVSGIPVLIKDNLAVNDGLPTSAGSAALEHNFPASEASAVRRLRSSGMIAIGRGNMSEWSNLRALRSVSGWSARGGQCRNPYALDRSPSGSSSGCAVAVAAGLVPLALGTETMGSITCPASVCGIVGLKPTLGLIPSDGMVPCVPSFDCLGPMGRSVRDVAWLLQVLVEPRQNYLQGLQPAALKGARLGVARAEWGFDDRVDRLMDEALKLLRQAGAVLVDPLEVPTLRGLGRDIGLVFACEFKDSLDGYLASASDKVPVRSLEQLIHFNLEHRQQEGLDFLDQDLLYRADVSGGRAHPQYAAARQRLRLEGPLLSLLQKHRLDAIVAPTTGPAWPIDPVYGDRFPGGGGGPPALAGLPHLTVPAGLIQGLPVGLSWYGPARSEARLLALGAAFEGLRGPLARPAMLPGLQARS